MESVPGSDCCNRARGEPRKKSVGAILAMVVFEFNTGIFETNSLSGISIYILSTRD